MIKNINELIDNSAISVKSKTSLKKNTTKFKKNFNIVIKKCLSNIDDHYKKDSETRNNRRNYRQIVGNVINSMYICKKLRIWIEMNYKKKWLRRPL